MLSCWAENSPSRPTFNELVYSVANVIRGPNQITIGKNDGGESKIIYNNQTACDIGSCTNIRRTASTTSNGVNQVNPDNDGSPERSYAARQSAAEDLKRKLEAVKAWDDQVTELLADDDTANEEGTTTALNSYNNCSPMASQQPPVANATANSSPQRATSIPPPSSISDFLRDDQSAYLIPK